MIIIMTGYLPLITFHSSICTPHITLPCPLSTSVGWDSLESNIRTLLSADPLTTMFGGDDAILRQVTC